MMNVSQEGRGAGWGLQRSVGVPVNGPACSLTGEGEETRSPGEVKSEKKTKRCPEKTRYHLQ